MLDRGRHLRVLISLGAELHTSEISYLPPDGDEVVLKVRFESGQVAVRPIGNELELSLSEFIDAVHHLKAWGDLLRGQYLLKPLEEAERVEDHSFALEQQGPVASMRFSTGGWRLSARYHVDTDTVVILPTEPGAMPWREWAACEEVLQMFVRVIYN